MSHPGLHHTLRYLHGMPRVQTERICKLPQFLQELFNKSVGHIAASSCEYQIFVASTFFSKSQPILTSRVACWKAKIKASALVTEIVSQQQLVAV